MQLQPMNVGEILDKSINFYKEQFRSYAVLGACSAVASAAISILKIILGEDGGFSLFVVLLINWFICSAITKKASEQILERELSNKEALRFAIRKFWPVLFGSILCYIVNILGFLLFIIPGIYFIVLYSLVTEVIVIEDKGPWSAFKISKHLIDDYWWHSCGVMIIATVLAYVFIIGIGLGVIEVIGQDPTAKIIGEIITLPFNCLVIPFPVIGSTVLYYDLKIRKENLDLHLMVDDLTIKK